MIPIIQINEPNAIKMHGRAWAIDFESQSGRRSTEYVGGSVGKLKDGVFSVEPFVIKSNKGFGSALRNCTIIGGTKLESASVEVESIEPASIKKGFFTVESATDRHRTFKVSTSARSGKTKIGLMTGSNNLKDYTWFGYLVGSEIRFWTQPSMVFGIPATLPISRDEIIECWSAISGNVTDAGLRFARVYQNCSRCGKVLTTPESLNRGRGPECDSLMYGSR